jgi:hypothetical protein
MHQATSRVLETELAVFTRNHEHHLQEASQATSSDHTALRTFRSRKRWVTAAQIVAKHGPIPIYFAVVDSGPTVEYEGELVDVQLDPSPSDPKTQKLLKHSGETTKPEGLWKETAGTLYLVRGCRKLGEAFPQASLLKFRGGVPLESTYTRAYALVRRRSSAA